MFRVINASASAQSRSTGRVSSPGSRQPGGKRNLVTGLLSFGREKLILWSAAVVIARERKMLLQCSAEQLRDMGISQADAEREAAREFFDVPAERLAMNGLLDSANRRATGRR